MLYGVRAAFLVCVLCQPVHSLSHPYTLESFYGDLFLFFFWYEIYQYSINQIVSPAHPQLLYASLRDGFIIIVVIVVTVTLFSTVATSDEIVATTKCVLYDYNQ